VEGAGGRLSAAFVATHAWELDADALRECPAFQANAQGGGEHSEHHQCANGIDGGYHRRMQRLRRWWWGSLHSPPPYALQNNPLM
jgi:hypothetical protein